MTPKELAELWESDDLVEIGMKADAVRARLHPDGIVTYALARDAEPIEPFLEILVRPGISAEQLVGILEHTRTACPASILPVFESGVAGAEYLKLVAVCRLYLVDIPNIQVSSTAVSFKVAQLALRFGANDFGIVGTNGEEEDFRRIIRAAGFIPKARNASYSALALY